MSAKRNLIERVQKNLGVGRKTAEETVNAVIDAIADTLRDGDNVSLSNFGTFRVVRLDERLVRNPATGVVVLRPEENVVRFRVSPSLKPYVNDQSGRDRLSVKNPKGVAK